MGSGKFRLGSSSLFNSASTLLGLNPINEYIWRQIVHSYEHLQKFWRPSACRTSAKISYVTQLKINNVRWKHSSEIVLKQSTHKLRFDAGQAPVHIFIQLSLGRYIRVFLNLGRFLVAPTIRQFYSSTSQETPVRK
jgi:hypothetical protein